MYILWLFMINIYRLKAFINIFIFSKIRIGLLFILQYKIIKTFMLLGRYIEEYRRILLKGNSMFTTWRICWHEIILNILMTCSLTFGSANNRFKTNLLRALSSDTDTKVHHGTDWWITAITVELRALCCVHNTHMWCHMRCLSIVVETAIVTLATWLRADTQTFWRQVDHLLGCREGTP